jgi:DNA (cytosine-5)-methyltransferase 1
MTGDSSRQIACVDLFCGAGGLTHGFALEGLRVVGGMDVDPACAYPYLHNNNAPFFERDLTDKSVGKEAAALFPDSGYKIIAGCAPCQPFSTYSQRYDTDRDGKWSLLRAFAHIVEEIRPDIVTMENVPALQRHEIFDEFVSGLDALGFHVWSNVVECADYGVPQTRKRIVLIGSRHGPIQLIRPTHLHHRTVRDAISGTQPLRAGWTSIYDPLHTSSELSPMNLERIRHSRPGGSWRDWPDHLVAACHRTSTGRSYPSVYGRMEWDKPAPTLTTQCFGFGNGRFGHPEQDRAISLREAAILQGFPPNYKFVPPGEPVQFSVVGRLIGNAVPVGLGRAIARSIRGHLQDHGEGGSAQAKRSLSVSEQVDP